MTEPEQRPQAPLDTERVRAHARRVLDSESFSKAHSLRRFLAYVVDETLAGRADTLKEYAIGVEVFGRGEGFDPRADTIVRVQARRLRSKLEQHYAAAGHPDGIAIHVPTGSYLPHFREVPVAAPSDAAATRPHWTWPPRGEPRDAPAAPLPVPRTTLIGRDAEVAAILGALRGGGARVLTLAGPGGSGKTRLALQVAAEAAADFPGGVSFVSLGSLADAADVAPTLAQALGLSRIERGSVAEALRAHVRATIRERTLLVLDNFEQLLAAAPLLVDLIESTTALTLLVTSQAVLHVSGEQCIPVRPLPVPDMARLPPLRRAGAQSGRRALRPPGRGAAAGLRADRRQRRPHRGNLRPPRRAAAGHRAGGGADPHPLAGADARTPRAAADPAHRRRPRPAGAAADAAPGDRLEPRAADRRREAPVPPSRGVRRLLHARGRRGGLQSAPGPRPVGPRRDVVARRQEPDPGSRRGAGRAALHDARDRARVRAGAARRERRASGDAARPRRLLPRARRGRPGTDHRRAAGRVAGALPARARQPPRRVRSPDRHPRRRLGAAPGARARPTTGIGTTIASKASPASRRCCGCRGWRRAPRRGPPPSPAAACSRRCSRRRRPSRRRCRSTASSATCAAWSGS